ncbi:hypothetical protein P7L91_10060 [Bisgaard Taxon 10/6]|uniref:hypothetical protein n=1 Tax=Exercitatus varius TaxID=67857 RepID=UPI00294B24CD|nr:hypothetical protein [Exercitatus varius]MDG2961175.1 hypothetical protein [Exercitatus varius]
MKKYLLLFSTLLSFCFSVFAAPLPKELVSDFKGLNIQDVRQDITLTDGILWIKLNYDAPIPETMGSSVIFDDVCISVYQRPEIWKKYNIKQIRVTTLVEWKAYVFNGGVKECLDVWTKNGAAEKYKQSPYFVEWQRE